MEIEVNGIKYQKIEHKPVRTSKASSKLLMMALMFGGLGLYNSGIKKTQLPDINIVNEYGLIQRKKSNLSSKERDSVVYQFERQYKQI